MARNRRSRRQLAVLGVAALLLAACGGGGGGGGGDDGGGGNGQGIPLLDRLSGDYLSVVLVRDSAGGTVSAQTSLLTSDGLGTLTFTEVYAVVSGTPFGPFNPGGATYTEDTDRTLQVTGLALAPLEGRVADDGSLAILSSRAPSNPVMAILMRRAAAPAVADLAGQWTRLSWNRLVAPAAAMSSACDATISATGVLTLDGASFTYNQDGVIDPSPYFLFQEQLAVQPDGWLVNTIPPSADVVRRGAISDDGNLVLLGGDASGAYLAAVTIFVRRDQVATTAALTGDYLECNFESSPFGYLSGWGPVGLDGVGGGTWSYAFDLEGAPFGPGPITVGYGVDPAGRVLLTDTGTNVSWLGTIGPGGRYAFLSGGYVAGSNPLLMVLLR